jgi:hypothetical protein
MSRSNWKKKVDKLDPKWEEPLQVVHGFDGRAFKLKITNDDPAIIFFFFSSKAFCDEVTLMIIIKFYMAKEFV